VTIIQGPKLSENVNETANLPVSLNTHAVPLVEDLDGQVKRCRICNYRCELIPGQSGICGVRLHQGDFIQATNYGLVSKADLERVEDRNFYHLFPGSRIFSLGGYGLNFPPTLEQARFVEPPSNAPGRFLPLERLAHFTIERQCRGVVFAFNEPTMWFEYILDAAKIIRANGMFTAMVTNGYMTLEALETIGYYMDGVLIEVNAFHERSFNTLTGRDNFQKVLEIARRALYKYKCHLEIQTRVVPGVNDSNSEMELLATWIKQGLGANVPWHLIGGFPGARPELDRIKEIGLNCGLNYIYVNEGMSVPAAEEPLAAIFDSTVNGNTYCYRCHSLVIDRHNEEVRLSGLEKNKCALCGATLSINSTLWK
jgi:pyruvate formate lyase activating enzyme